MSRVTTPEVRYQDEDGRWVTRHTVQRACNGCRRPIGDATDAELAAAVNGQPLPDVRHECGCQVDPASGTGGRQP